MIIPKSRLSLVPILLIPLLILVHNCFTYPLMEGYDAIRHIKYTQILIEKIRLPSWEETTQAYNPPLFYLISGSTIKLYSYIFKKDFIDSIISWRITGSIMTIISFYIWTKIYLIFNPNKKNASFFLLLIISLPAIYKSAAMFTTETFNFFLSSLIIFYFIRVFLINKSLLNTVILSVMVSMALLTRVTFFALAGAILIGICIDFCFNKYHKIKFIKIISIYIFIILILTGWFYIGLQSGKFIELGQYSKKVEKQYAGVPLYGRQRIEFYYDVPFILTMSYPVRPYLSRPSFLLPIYYSDFWGDYWNYFSQKRFHLEQVSSVSQNRLYFPAGRIIYLAWQNRINLVSTILIIVGFVFISLKNILNLILKKADKKTIGELFMSSLIFLTWTSFLIILTKYPGEGDFIKASYTIGIIPIYLYFSVSFLFSYIRRYKYIYIIFQVYLVITVINNLYFSFY